MKLQSIRLKWILLFGIMLSILGSSICFGKETGVMKIALCHLEVSCGLQESNLEKIERAVEIAGERGAKFRPVARDARAVCREGIYSAHRSPFGV